VSVVFDSEKIFVRPSPTAHIDALAGSLPGDRNDVHLKTQRIIFLNSQGYVATLSDGTVVKVFRTVFTSGSEPVRRELRMMILAGDCSVTPLGRLFSKGTLCGIVMSCGTSIVPPATEPTAVSVVDPSLPVATRVWVIDQLRNLVTRLHGHHIIHGDIKPSNLLICQTSSGPQLRLCDFGCANVESEAEPSRALSIRYTSPFILNVYPPVPLSREQDLYATGISIWEIHTGRIPFDSILDEGEVEDHIRNGGRPDVRSFDVGLANIIAQYLNAGNRAPQASR